MPRSPTCGGTAFRTWRCSSRRSVTPTLSARTASTRPTPTSQRPTQSRRSVACYSSGATTSLAPCAASSVTQSRPNPRSSTLDRGKADLPSILRTSVGLALAGYGRADRLADSAEKLDGGQVFQHDGPAGVVAQRDAPVRVLVPGAGNVLRAPVTDGVGQ